MQANKYQVLARETMNKQLIDKDQLINGVMGLCGEAGECIDLVKKHLHQGHELDKEKLVEELGDVCWYICEIASYLNISFEEILDKNIDKLSKRYPNGFDRNNSINRL